MQFRKHLSQSLYSNQEKRKTMSRLFSILVFLIIFIFTTLTPFRPNHSTVQAAPNLANVYLKWDLDETAVNELSKWDVVIVDMENQKTNPDALKKLKILNPKIVILAYISLQEVHKDPSILGSDLRTKLAAGIADNWYLVDTNGNKMSPWPNNYMMNVTDKCPEVNGKRWNTYLAQFVSSEILSTGLWDGVFYDNAWGGVDWFTKGKADLDRDGTADVSPDNLWKEGIKTILNKTRELTKNRYAFVVNQGPGHREYRSESNGAFLETFPEFGWNYTMQVYDFQGSAGAQPRFMIINSNTKNTGKRTDYREMRYGLASTLLKNGYFSFDYGDQAHNQTWWYDEYSINLGVPTGEPVSVNKKSKYQEDGVWKREYANGIALVNPSSKTQTVELPGEYEKLIGTQDTKTNNGQIVDRVSIPAKDGLVMLRTIQTVKNTVFKNGSFLRFFKSKGEKARTGMFTSEKDVPGGARVFVGDLNGDREEEKVIVNGAKLEVKKSNGDSWWSTYPFGTNFKGEIFMNVGKLSPSDSFRIAVAAYPGDKVMVYSAEGKKLKDLQPLGAKFKGGYSVALGDIDNDGNGELVVGVGSGKTSEVLVYNTKLDSIKKRFSPYGKYTSGIEVALGDMQGDGLQEIVTISRNTTPLVRVSNSGGKKISEFRATGVLASQRLFLSTADVNTDGVDEIVLMN